MQFIFILFFIFSFKSRAFDIKILENNKESHSQELFWEDIQQVNRWKDAHKLQNELKEKAILTLRETFSDKKVLGPRCTLNFISLLTHQALKNSLIHTKEELVIFNKYLRHENLIDDLLYRILQQGTKITLNHKKNATLSLPRRPFDLNTRFNAGMNLNYFFKPYRNWSHDLSGCALETFYEVINSLYWKNSPRRNQELFKIHYLGVVDGHIDLKTFNYLETIRKSVENNWEITLKRYLNIILNAKDKLTQNPEDFPSHDFSTQNLSRKNKITNRRLLYETFDSTQIILLSQVIQNLSKRIDANLVSLNWQFSPESNDHEIYVLSPMEQYRVAINFLRKDMAELARSDAFRNHSIKYAHLIMAAFETGYIKSAELEEIIKLEEIWNPKSPKWQRYAQMALGLAGRSSFFLPPPLNVIGAIGVVLMESAIINNHETYEPLQNGNVIL